jgi:hypothetical protein
MMALTPVTGAAARNGAATKLVGARIGLRVIAHPGNGHTVPQVTGQREIVRPALVRPARTGHRSNGPGVQGRTARTGRRSAATRAAKAVRRADPAVPTIGAVPMIGEELGRISVGRLVATTGRLSAARSSRIRTRPSPS